MEGYQNAVPSNNGLNFQPQVPDTSLGPMTHVYRPTFDGGVYVAPPGIAVCHSSLPYFVSHPPYVHFLTLQKLPSRAAMFAQPPLVAVPAAAPAVAVCPGYMASAPVYTTLGYVGDDGIIAPREVVVRFSSQNEFTMHKETH